MRVFLIIVVILAAIGGWLYFYERETLDRLMKGEFVTEPEPQPAPNPEPRPENATAAPRKAPEKADSVVPASPAMLRVPDLDGDLYVNGEPTEPGKTLELPPGRALVTGYDNGRYVHDLVELKSGESTEPKATTRKGSSETGWSTFQGNSLRTGYSHVRDRQALEPVWQVDLKDKVDCSPVIVGDLALISTGQSLITAIDLRDGSVAWKQGRMGSAISPIATEKYAFAGADTGQFGGYLLKNGKQRGDLFLESYPVAMAAISEEAFLVSTRGTKVFSIGTKRRFTGRLPLKSNWETELPELTAGTGSPVILDKTAVFSTGKGLVALSLTDGKRLWPATGSTVEGVSLKNNISLSFADETHFRIPTPAAHEGRVYAALDKTLRGVDADTGRVVWEQSLPDKATSSISLAHETLYFGTADGHVEARSLKDGGAIFRVRVSDQPVFASPVLFRDKLLVATAEGHVHLRNSFSGKEPAVDKTLAGAPVNSTPAVWDDGILVINRKGKAVRYR
ncbi:MAG: PQQ-binding-like beta-propeller repeat protein [Acidobacteriota bacterium]|nr:PQQ-binding-like beta-propeller repeat protein [Acidobacteriota bacterium]